ncbi:MAG: hypothetical protein GYA55_07835, partial [SAR324 cluster bacterium]|nr:hypothetical protein [SAR324 cluster bacterium]
VFLASFLPNFFSDFFVGVIIAGLLSQYLPLIKKPDIKIIGKYFCDSTTNNKPKLAFSIKNTGNVNFKEKEVFWHLYIKKDIAIRSTEVEKGLIYSYCKIDDEEYCNGPQKLDTPLRGM